MSDNYPSAKYSIFGGANLAILRDFAVEHTEFTYGIASAKISYFSEPLKILLSFNLMFLLL